jgi:glycerol-3-phosphate dehydrogenase (NAD(P)+)
MKVIVIGAGAWGTALAANAAAQGRHQVSLWARNPERLQALQAQRSNAAYLPGVELPAALSFVGGDVQAAAAEQDLVVLAGPVAACSVNWSICPFLWLGFPKALSCRKRARRSAA